MGSVRQDHYDVLGVKPDAPEEVIRAAYRALAAKYHPDRNPGDSDAVSKLTRLNAAFQVLGDPAKRKQYDDARSGTAHSPSHDAAASRVGFAKRSGFWLTMAVLSVVAMADGLPRFIGGVCLLVSVLGLMGSREAR